MLTLTESSNLTGQCAVHGPSNDVRTIQKAMNTLSRWVANCRQDTSLTIWMYGITSSIPLESDQPQPFHSRRFINISPCSRASSSA
jgi:hypothetical protein